MSSADLEEYSNCGSGCGDIIIPGEVSSIVDGLLDKQGRQNTDKGGYGHLHQFGHISFEEASRELALPARKNLGKIIEDDANNFYDRLLSVFHVRKKDDVFRELNVPNEKNRLTDVWAQLSQTLPNTENTGVFLANVAYSHLSDHKRGESKGLVLFINTVRSVNKDTLEQTSPSEIRKWFVKSYYTLHDPQLSNTYALMLKFGDKEEKELALNAIKGFFGDDKQKTNYQGLISVYQQAIKDFVEKNK